MAKTKTTREMTEDGADANRFHQALGAKWMVEAIVRECRTVYRLNRNAQQFANDLEGRWQDEAFWRPAPSEIDFEIVGRLADKADNFVHSAVLPVDPAIHVEGLTGGMKEIRDELRKFYVEATGSNPWSSTRSRRR